MRSLLLFTLAIRDFCARIFARLPIGERRTLAAGRYDKVWGDRLRAIHAVRDEVTLSRVLSHVQRAEASRRGLGERYPMVVEGRLIDLPLDAAADMLRSVVARTVLKQVRDDTTKIIETGSGWGEHLCTIYLEGGPRHATYYALEPVREGRRCAETLARYEPGLRMKSGFFDYTAPQYRVPRDDGHTVLLSVHSVEQVAEIHPDVILAALDLGTAVTGVHLEPVGWQTRPEAEWSEITARHAARCREMNYNRNLIPLLRDCESRGFIDIDTVHTDFIGLPHNPGTLVIWRKRSPEKPIAAGQI